MVCKTIANQREGGEGRVALKTEEELRQLILANFEEGDIFRNEDVIRFSKSIEPKNQDRYHPNRIKDCTSTAKLHQ